MDFTKNNYKLCAIDQIVNGDLFCQESYQKTFGKDSKLPSGITGPEIQLILIRHILEGNSVELVFRPKS